MQVLPRYGPDSVSPVDARTEGPLASPRIMTTRTNPDLIASSWNRHTLAVAVFLALFLTWQLVVPAAALFAQRPARFGWQMYSARPNLPQAWIVDAAGAETAVQVEQFFAQLRTEVDFADALRAGLCDASGAVAVKIIDPRGRKAEVLDCP